MIIAVVFALLAAAFHVFAFLMESALWSRPAVRRFMVGRADVAEDVRLWAFNQGFYNLFLAIGAAVGAVAWLTGADAVGRTLVVFTCASMAAAGVVLFLSDRRLWRSALGQSVPPGIAVIAALLA
ncbi:DUF1304 domain-containing protein [Microbacterium sp.]|uniref:DUF1304 domain-containing protein n=1 Tax=Microbacterium sp. TaxID=51671 RepID=UPI0028115108|nr:DUF1304 domain-containing protein [Microbacterium sp.]